MRIGLKADDDCANDKLWKEQRSLAQNALRFLCLKNGSKDIDILILTELNKLIDRLETLDPVVQSIVSLTISLRHKFVKQISAKVTNT